MMRYLMVLTLYRPCAGAGDTMMNKTDMVPAFLGSIVQRDRQKSKQTSMKDE